MLDKKPRFNEAFYCLNDVHKIYFYREIHCIIS
jgi:hypothetical protein